MNRIGIALSGGGFRASLYHLGLVRFLRDAGVLSQVSHITSVSGGSIFGAHLVLNWDRYNGSPEEFDAVASEFLAFVQLDVRNRIFRRFPLTSLLRWPFRLLGKSRRKLTRTGLLESHYENHLYGDVSLFELPKSPQLHILATNLTEGCLSSFHRDGILMVRRQRLGPIWIESVHAGLATVSMAVAASSAFPGFFPPLELTGADVGAKAGEFDRQSFTDGGVFDNLGVRMFRCLERPLLVDNPLSDDDFLDFPAAVEALKAAGASSEETPLRRLAQVLVGSFAAPDLTRLPEPEAPSPLAAPACENGKGDREAFLMSSLCQVIRHYQFQLDPLFAALTPEDADAEALLRLSRRGARLLDRADQVWLNRHLVDAAFVQATGRGCFRRLNTALDGVLVSDVGKQIQVLSNRPPGGLIRTSMRATDILMDRVWQLENETFRDAPGFVFAAVTDVVEPDEDATALHPEVQLQVARTRTDLDRFSPLEISSLVRHGYCVARKACRSRPDLFGADLPGNEPWDPIAAPAAASSAPLVSSVMGGPVRETAQATRDARTLQRSSIRRIWSTLLDRRDWASYVYVPILVPILTLLPYFIVKSYQRSHRVSQLVESLSQGSRDLGIMTTLLDGPMKPWPAEPFEELPALEPPDFHGFEVLQDSRILDLRPWNPVSGKDDATSLVYGYRRMKVRKLPENDDNHVFRVKLLATSAKTTVRFPPQKLQPHLRRSNVETSKNGDQVCQWQMSVDFSKMPAGEFVDLIYEHYSPGIFMERGSKSASIAIHFQADTAEVTRWFLMPQGREYASYRILRYEEGMPEKVEQVQVVTEYLAEDSTILAYKLNAAKAGYVYDVTWFYK